MSRGFSTYLDAARFVAAIVVLASHWAYERFTGGSYLWIREINLGSDAVVVFFVLSGLVIAYTAEVKDHSGGSFLFSRATRVLSVALPALLLGFALDRIGVWANPAAYDGWWYRPLPLTETLWYGLSFSSEWSIPGVRIGSNGPYWSLSYEVAYYLLFAAAVYLAGVARIVALAALAFLVGVKVLLLLPVWLLGVALWQLLRDGRIAMSSVGAGVAMLAPLLLYGACLAGGVPEALTAATGAIFGIDPAFVAALLGFSDEFVWNLLVGLLFAVHLAGVAAWTAGGEAGAREPIAAGVRWLAGASFSIYLFHYPAMQFFDATWPETGTGPLRDAALLVATLAACFLFAAAFERRLGAVRRAVRALTALFVAPKSAPQRLPAAE